MGELTDATKNKYSDDTWISWNPDNKKSVLKIKVKTCLIIG